MSQSFKGHHGGSRGAGGRVTCFPETGACKWAVWDNSHKNQSPNLMIDASYKSKQTGQWTKKTSFYYSEAVALLKALPDALDFMRELEEKVNPGGMGRMNYGGSVATPVDLTEYDDDDNSEF